MQVCSRRHRLSIGQGSGRLCMPGARRGPPGIKSCFSQMEWRGRTERVRDVSRMLCWRRFSAAVFTRWQRFLMYGSVNTCCNKRPDTYFPGSLFCAGLFASTTLLPAQVVLTHGPQIGSSNPITADPPVERPHTQPCTVQLFTQSGIRRFQRQGFQLRAALRMPRPVGQGGLLGRLHGHGRPPV